MISITIPLQIRYDPLTGLEKSSPLEFIRSPEFKDKISRWAVNINESYCLILFIFHAFQALQFIFNAYAINKDDYESI